VKTGSGAAAVQIVYSSRRGSREIEHIGSALDEAELEALKAAARQRMAAGQGELTTLGLIYHHKRDSIEAHLAIVFAALAVSRAIEAMVAPPVGAGRRVQRGYTRPSGSGG
jgi:hypothetical protein